MSTTALVFFICFFVLMFYDLIVVIKRGTNSSVSQFLINLGFKSPVFCITFGTAIGHLFIYMVPNEHWGPDQSPYALITKNALMIGSTMVIYEGVRRVFVYVVERFKK